MALVIEACDPDTTDGACLFADREIIVQGFMSFWPRMLPMDRMPRSLLLPSRHVLREMNFAVRSVYNGSMMIRPDGYTVVTVNTAAVSDALIYTSQLWAYSSEWATWATKRRAFRFARDTFFYVDTQQPVVMARCHVANVSTDAAANELWPEGSAGPEGNFYALSKVTELVTVEAWIMSRRVPQIL